MPTAVLMITGQIAVMKITKIADGSLLRNAASDSGSQASGGTVRSTWKIGSRPRIAQVDWPTSVPSATPTVAAVLRLNHFEFFFKIMVPAAAPYIFTGLRIGIGLSWLAIVAAEMLIGGVGIGFFIWDAWNSSHISEIILALIYVGMIGFVLDRIVAAVATIVTRGTAAN